MVQTFPATRTAIALTVGIMAAALSMSAAAEAEEAPTAAEISAAVSDHTYQGSMSAAESGFAEYYAPDGTIRGDGYSGEWRAEAGAMCFQYGDKPERCFEVTINGPSMVMYKDGKIDGNGMLIEGNPLGF